MPWAPAYATPAELAHFMGDAVAPDDAELTLAIETASRAADRTCDRQFGIVDAPKSRWYDAVFDATSPFGPQRRWTVAIDDLMTADGLTVALGDGVNATATLAGCLPTPINAVVNGKPWTKLVLPQGVSVAPGTKVRVTALFGWAQVPGAVKMATLIQASRLFSRRYAPFGVAGNPEVGQLRLLDKLDVDLITSVRPYLRIWGAV